MTVTPSLAKQPVESAPMVPGTVSASRLAAMQAKVKDLRGPEVMPESVRLKRINDERAARKALLAVDEAEVRRREAERLQALEAAHLKLWNQSDRVRELHSRMLLCDVLAERESQLRLRRHLLGLEKSEQAAFHAALLQRLEASHLMKPQTSLSCCTSVTKWCKIGVLQVEARAEGESLNAKRRYALELRAMQDEQLEELRRTILEERRLKKVEARRIRQAAEDDAEIARRQAVESRQKSRLAVEATKAANEALEALKLEQREKERQEDDRIIEAARQRQAAMDARRAEEAKAAAEKRARREATAAAMEQTNRHVASQEAHRLQAAIDAAEAEASDAAETRRRQQDAAWADIVRSRDEQLAAKRAAKGSLKAAQKRAAHLAAEATVAAKAEEAARSTALRERHRQQVAFLDKQVALKEAKAAILDRQEQEEDDARLWALAKKEALFKEYADICVGEWQKRDLDTLPIALHLAAKTKDIRPSI